VKAADITTKPTQKELRDVFNLNRSVEQLTDAKLLLTRAAFMDEPEKSQAREAAHVLIRWAIESLQEVPE